MRSRHDAAVRQHDAAGVGRRDAPAGLPRGARVGDQAAAGAPPDRGDGERGDERQAEPAAVGAGEQAGRDRDADMRLALHQQPGRGGEREEQGEHHLTTKSAALPCAACARSIRCVKAATHPHS